MQKLLTLSILTMLLFGRGCTADEGEPIVILIEEGLCISLGFFIFLAGQVVVQSIDVGDQEGRNAISTRLRRWDDLSFDHIEPEAFKSNAGGSYPMGCYKLAPDGI
ncbi:hypothetical protein [Algoriphagus sp. Y33]|uniref:hypothetical protein n=1 Tax=Algoriphagus sp. Y33 TaxID=2772483 RepID=UPI001781D5D2|nr:hypothetical protein [Algoriphagus sp. Y33]